MSLGTGLARLALLSAVVVTASCGDGVPTAPDSLPSSSSSSSSSSGSGSGTSATLAYVQDIKPILDADCGVCHGTSRPEKGVTVTTYAGVMQQVTAGSASSRLVRETASNGSMYRYFTGDRATKSSRIRSWIVDFKAVESR